MKKLIALLLILISIRIEAQTIKAAVLNVKDKIIFGAKQVKGISDSIRPGSTDLDTVPTTRAVQRWVASHGGASTPGGLTSQLQYNSAGSLGGIVGATTDGNRLTLLSPIINGSISSPSTIFSAWDTVVTTGSIYRNATTIHIGGLGATGPTINIGANPTPSSTTKIINIGTGGAAASITQINIGNPTASSANSIRINFTPATDAAGDIPYKTSASVLIPLHIGSTNQVLSVVGGLPAWITSLQWNNGGNTLGSDGSFGSANNYGFGFYTNGILRANFSAAGKLTVQSFVAAYGSKMTLSSVRDIPDVAATDSMINKKMIDSATTVVCVGCTKAFDSATNTLTIYIDSTVTTNTQTASYTPVITDGKGVVIEMNVGTSNNLTLPTNASVAFPVGTILTVRQVGVGQTTVAAPGGGGVESAGNRYKIAEQFGVIQLRKTATNTWSMYGNTAN